MKLLSCLSGGYFGACLGSQLDDKSLGFRAAVVPEFFEGDGGDASNLLLILGDASLGPSCCQSLAKSFQPEFRPLVLLGGNPAADGVLAYAKCILKCLADRGVRRITVFGYGDGGSLAQALALADSRLVRRLILLNAATRLRPGCVLRALDALESFLPLGLPFKSSSADFDSRSELHRIVCPVLIVVSGTANAYCSNQAALLGQRIPNSWLTCIGEHDEAEQIMHMAALAKDFMQVSPKQPQKNRG
jgi:pimeloyl-ACP methyl ester carboxylesterase